MRILATLLLVFCLSSCSRDEESNAQTREIMGIFKMLSLVSDTALDLNLDGVATTDFKNELDVFYSYYRNHPLKINENSLLEIIIPFASFFPEYNNYDIDYLSRGDLAYVKYYKKNNMIEYRRGNNSEEYQLQYGMPIIKNIEMLPDMKIKVTVYQRFYHHPDGWYDTILTGIYEKK